MTLVRQVELTQVEPLILTSMSSQTAYKRLGFKKICWLDTKDLVENSIISLKGEETLYTVEKIHDMEIDHREINRTWLVGGL